MSAPTERTPLISNKTYDAGCLACACLDKREAAAAPQKEKRIIVPSKMEPKTLLANERTFLHWLSVSVLLGMLALTVLRIPTSQGPLFSFLGYSLLLLCLGFMGYALAVFHNRALKIVSGERVRFDDNKGPVVLAIVMILAFVFTGVAQMGYTM
eukprot:RCo012216